MNAIVNLAFEENLVRFIEKDGEPWFVGKDICAVLSIKDHHQALEGLDNDERGGCTVPTPSGDQSMIVVSEPGVYRLVFRSRKPEAERFKRWLAHEVIPAIRKTGQYGNAAPVPPALDVDAPLAARVETVRLASRLFGRARARELWNVIGLPAVPDATPEPESDPQACLEALLNFEAGDDLIVDLIRTGSDKRLGACGLRREQGGVWVANGHPVIREALAGFPAFWRTLARLPGHRARVMKFEGRAHRATFVRLD
jgi:prophage antirepressor-like protein